MPPPSAYTPVPAGKRPSIYHLPPVPHFYFSHDWKGKVFWQAMDPCGCQFFHQKLQAMIPEDVQMIISDLKDQICVLMMDQLGSKVIKKLFEVCDEEQMTQLVSTVTADVYFLKAICCNSQGSQSMIKFLQCLTTPKQISDVMSAFQQITVPLANRKFGYAVIDHCFRLYPVPAKETKPILEVIADNYLTIATNPWGSSILMNILSSDLYGLESRPRILMAIIEDAYQLSQNLFGRPLLVSIVAYGSQDVVRDIIAKLRKDFAFLSMNKVAYSLVKALMMKDRQKYLPQIINDIIESPSFKIVQLHPFGKLVLQHALEHSVGTDAETLMIRLLSGGSLSHHDGKNVLPKKRKREKIRYCTNDFS